jgi:hypothetical protein
MRKIFLMFSIAMAMAVNGYAQEEGASVEQENAVSVKKTTTTAKKKKRPANGKNIVSVEPIRIWSGLRFKYERVFEDKYTAGSQATIYYGLHPGFQLAPFGRLYFKQNAPEGLYAQGKIVLGINQSIFDVYSGNSWTTSEKKETFFNYGAGVALGYQTIFGSRDQWSIDVTMGLKYVSPIPEPKLSDEDFGLANAVDNAAWYLTGAGSWLDFLITIGYRF